MQHRVYGDEYRQTILCIDSYENNIPVGRIYNLHRSEGVPFQGIVPFLTRMEDTLNDLEFPKSFTAARSFGPAPEGLWIVTAVTSALGLLWLALEEKKRRAANV